jgi:hypothetical protein
MSVSCECCVLSCRGLCVGLITRPQCGVSDCDLEASIMRRPWPMRGCCAMGKTCIICPNKLTSSAETRSRWVPFNLKPFWFA